MEKVEGDLTSAPDISKSLAELYQNPILQKKIAKLDEGNSKGEVFCWLAYYHLSDHLQEELAALKDFLPSDEKIFLLDPEQTAEVIDHKCSLPQESKEGKPVADGMLITESGKIVGVCEYGTTLQSSQKREQSQGYFKAALPVDLTLLHPQECQEKMNDLLQKFHPEISPNIRFKERRYVVVYATTEDAGKAPHLENGESYRVPTKIVRVPISKNKLDEAVRDLKDKIELI